MAFDGTKALTTILGMVAIWMVSAAVFNFFGIGFATYGNYLFWLIALVIFSYVLNPKTPSLFIAKYSAS